MTVNLVDKLGNWNPQLFREIKVRLDGINIVRFSIVSLVNQLFIWMLYRNKLPIAPPLGEYKDTIYSPYCTGNTHRHHLDYPCLRDSLGKFIINWPSWYLDVCFSLSFLGIFALLISGTFLLINDIEKEERRGTLNLIRLSPQSSEKILIGKLLGVPIVVYLCGLIALPLHLWLGLTLHISFLQLLSYYLVLIAWCGFIYSLALLLSFVGSGLGGFKPLLAMAIVAIFIFSCFSHSSEIIGNLINLLSPMFILKHLILAGQANTNNVHHSLSYFVGDLKSLYFFKFPIGKNWQLATPLLLLIYTLGILAIWQGLKRFVSNPGSTIFSKYQSYIIVGSVELILLGLALPYSHNNSSFFGLFFLNLLLFVGLIVALTPDRQSLYNWTRYLHQIVPHRQGLSFRFLMLDLIWGEKSPPLIALAINLVIAGFVLTPWLLVTQSFISWIFALNLILIYACLSQLILLMKLSKRAIWATCVVGGLIFAPSIILGMLSLKTDTVPGLWLSLTFPVFWGWEAIDKASPMLIFLSMLFQWSVLGVLSFYLIRRLNLVGESASQALLNSSNQS
jgi:hypothetical protein